MGSYVYGAPLLLLTFMAGFFLEVGRVFGAQIESFPSPRQNSVRFLFKSVRVLAFTVYFAVFCVYYIGGAGFISMSSREAPLETATESLPRSVLKDIKHVLSTHETARYVLTVFNVLGPSASALIGWILAYLLIFLFHRPSNTAGGMRDISEMDNLFKSMRSFDPLKYVDISKGVFVGLQSPQSLTGLQFDQHLGKPLYVPWLLFKETHAQILGSTGSGKGIALGVLGYQFALHRETLIVFDPKGDARLPLVLTQAALKSSAEFIFLDLQAQAKAQFNLLDGATDYEIEELLIAGLGLQPSSGEGNYYRGIDQDAAEQVSKIAVQDAILHSVTLPRLLEIAQFSKQISKADNFVRRLRQVCELRVIQTSHNIGLMRHIEQGSVIYIRGSTDNHRVKMLQTMLLIRILQIIKLRSTDQPCKAGHAGSAARPVCLILDEFKHLLSPVALDMLGVVRELGCHALLAHQSLADLAACPGLERKDVEPVVVDNATLKLVFRIGDDQAARGFANKSGQERTYKESFKPQGDGLDVVKSWSEMQHPRMSADLFLHLHRPSEALAPYTAGVLFGLGLAKLFSLSPIVVSGKLAPPKEAPLHTKSIVGNASDLI